MDSKKQAKYPFEKLLTAFDILETRGQAEFLEYCHRAEMPSEDIERVLNKHRYITDPEFRAKIDGIKRKIAEKLRGTDLELEEVPF